MRIGKIEILTRKELSRRLRVRQKDGYRNAMLQIADAKQVLLGREAQIRDCKIDGKVVLMGDEAYIVGNTIKATDIGIRIM